MTWGQFLQTDPVGYEDDLNLYAYVRNDPLNNSDPTGMALVCDNQGNCRETVEIVVTAQRPQLTQEQFSEVSNNISNELAVDAAVNYVAPAIIAGAGGGIIAVGSRGTAAVIGLGDDAAAVAGAIGSSHTVRGAAGSAAADVVGQAVDPSRTGPIDLAQTVRAAVVGAVAGGAFGRTEGLGNQVVVGGFLAAAGTPFINPGSTLQDQLIAGAVGAATTTANTLQSLAAAVGESLFGHPRERR